MSAIRYPVVELRQYTLRPGQREVLIELFDRELVESQEAEGMAIVGQFRDLDDPGRFVWLRGFDSMPARAQALASFYGGPVWKAHAAQANATMIDSDNVLLLRPVTGESGFPAPAAARPPAGYAPAPASRVLVTLYSRDRPFGQDFTDFFERQARPVLTATGATPLACLQTEYAENTFPALPVRTGEHVFAWLAQFPSHAHLDSHRRQLEGSASWRGQVRPALSAMTTGEPQHLRLAPTGRSLLR
jgi:quinol monooxygenase YgiN